MVGGWESEASETIENAENIFEDYFAKFYWNVLCIRIPLRLVMPG